MKKTLVSLTFVGVVFFQPAFAATREIVREEPRMQGGFTPRDLQARDDASLRALEDEALVANPSRRVPPSKNPPATTVIRVIFNDVEGVLSSGTASESGTVIKFEHETTPLRPGSPHFSHVISLDLATHTTTVSKTRSSTDSVGGFSTAQTAQREKNPDKFSMDVNGMLSNLQYMVDNETDPEKKAQLRRWMTKVSAELPATSTQQGVGGNSITMYLLSVRSDQVVTDLSYSITNSSAAPWYQLRSTFNTTDGTIATVINGVKTVLTKQSDPGTWLNNILDHLSFLETWAAGEANAAWKGRVDQAIGKLKQMAGGLASVTVNFAPANSPAGTPLVTRSAAEYAGGIIQIQSKGIPGPKFNFQQMITLNSTTGVITVLEHTAGIPRFGNTTVISKASNPTLYTKYLSLMRTQLQEMYSKEKNAAKKAQIRKWIDVVVRASHSRPDRVVDTPPCRTCAIP